jgi:hypothetical protein
MIPQYRYTVWCGLPKSPTVPVPTLPISEVLWINLYLCGSLHTTRGLFEPTVMFFGLCNSQVTFQAFMNEIFAELIREGTVKVYMDNILVSMETMEEHQETNWRVFQILQENKLYLKPEKCEFEKKEIKFLGVIIRNSQIRMDPKKVAVIMDWSIPKTKKDMQAFWGFCNFYCCFIKDFGKITKPMTLLMGNVEFDWGILQQSAYKALKEAVAEEVILYVPHDTGKFRVEADTSGYVMGAVLSQLIDEKWRPVAFMSKAFNEAE